MRHSDKRIIAVIPARGGSKRLPGKNIRPLGGLPLIAWTIQAAISSKMFHEVLVSTDDPEIARISKQHGASVPWLRKTELASDTACSIAVVLDALERHEATGIKFDHVALLQPTSPFRSPETIVAGLSLCISATEAPVISVSPARTHPALCYTIDSDRKLHGYCVKNQPGSLRSQDLPPVFEINGAFYAAPVAFLRQEKSFICSNSAAFVMYSPEESIDIDDEWDWQVAEWVASARASNRFQQ